ncbi:MAG: GxxExxY protein [Ardenticatenaceae bacterium]|nr:GxxExxY protein [Ardenticatenaceae bacterium]
MKKIGEMNRPEDEITKKIIGAAITVHKELGPGLLESAYQKCLAYEMSQLGLNLKIEHPLQLNYKGNQIDAGYRLDFLVEEKVIVEIKSVKKLEQIHKAQLITYLKISGLKVGLLLNFNTILLKRGGIQRVVFNL